MYKERKKTLFLKDLKFLKSDLIVVENKEWLISSDSQSACVSLSLPADLYVLLEINQATEVFKFIFIRGRQDSNKLRNGRDMHTVC